MSGIVAEEETEAKTAERPGAIGAGRAGGAPTAPYAWSARRKIKKRRSRLIWIAIVVVVGGLTWFWLWHRHRAALAAASVVSPDEIIEVAIGNVEKSVESSGTVASNVDVDIKCRASGEVQKLPFDISQTVKKGELLCQLDPTDEKLAVRSASAMVAQSDAKLAQAKENLDQAEKNLATTRERDQAALVAAKVKAANLRLKADRQKQLIAAHLGSPEEAESAETDASDALNAQRVAEVAIEELDQQAIAVEFKRQDVKTAEAQLDANQIALDNSKQQLAYTTVLSPIDGTVSALDVQLGTIVASGTDAINGGTTILTLSDLSHIYVLATVDESDIGGVRVGQAARVMVDSYPSRTFQGTVSRVAVKGVSSSNVVTFEVKVEVTDVNKELLKPQMTADVMIIEASKQNVLMIPSAALRHDKQGSYVADPTGARHDVTSGLEGADNIEILSGLKEHDKAVLVTAELPTKWKSESHP